MGPGMNSGVGRPESIGFLFRKYFPKEALDSAPEETDGESDSDKSRDEQLDNIASGSRIQVSVGVFGKGHG